VQKEEILQTISKLLPDLKKRYHIERLSLFGSYARGDADKQSDVDLLVDFSVTPDLLTFIELEEFLSEKVGKKVDLIPQRKLKTSLKNRVMKEAIAL
jgi:predicted nucleotidyltransferase